jgi:hypothetical protein
VKHYEPRKGSVPYRVIAYLKTLPPGTKVSTGDLCAIADVKSRHLFTAFMAKAREGGAVTGERGRTTMWSLPTKPAEYFVASDDPRIPKVVPGWKPPQMRAPRQSC